MGVGGDRVGYGGFSGKMGFLWKNRGFIENGVLMGFWSRIRGK